MGRRGFAMRRFGRESSRLRCRGRLNRACLRDATRQSRVAALDRHRLAATLEAASCRPAADEEAARDWLGGGGSVARRLPYPRAATSCSRRRQRACDQQDRRNEPRCRPALGSNSSAEDRVQGRAGEECRHRPRANPHDRRRRADPRGLAAAHRASHSSSSGRACGRGSLSRSLQTAPQVRFAPRTEAPRLPGVWLGARGQHARG